MVGRDSLRPKAFLFHGLSTAEPADAVAEEGENNQGGTCGRNSDNCSLVPVDPGGVLLVERRFSKTVCLDAVAADSIADVANRAGRKTLDAGLA